MNRFTANPKTTLGGVLLLALSAISAGIQWSQDGFGDPSEFSAAIGMFVTGVIALFAKDADPNPPGTF